MKKYLLEMIGTALLVLFTCGIAVLSGGNLLTTALGFGLVLFVLIMVIGPKTGCHVNPAVTIAMLLKKQISGKDALCYIGFQVLGAFIGSALLLLFVNDLGFGANAVNTVTILNGGLAADVNFWNILVAFIVEIVLTFVFVTTIMVVALRKDKLPLVVVALTIGLCLTLVHLLGINLTGTSVNPARSFAPAVFAAIMGDSTSLSQVYIWILAPIIGGVLAALAVKCPCLNLLEEEKEETATTPEVK